MTFRPLLISVGILGAVAATAAEPADSLTLNVGTFIASNFKVGMNQVFGSLAAQGVTVDSAEVIRLVAAQLSEPYSEEAHRRSGEYISRVIRERSERVAREFLDRAAAAKGAVVLPSGTVMQTLIEGVGEAPAPDDMISMRYTGTLPDGTVFDSVSPDEEPMRARPSDLVAGMTEGLTHMKAGGRYILTIPSDKAYGSAGAGGVIPPDTPIRFEIELIEIIK